MNNKIVSKIIDVLASTNTIRQEYNIYSKLIRCTLRKEFNLSPEEAKKWGDFDVFISGLKEALKNTGVVRTFNGKPLADVLSEVLTEVADEVPDDAPGDVTTHHHHNNHQQRPLTPLIDFFGFGSGSLNNNNNNNNTEQKVPGDLIDPLLEEPVQEQEPTQPVNHPIQEESPPVVPVNMPPPPSPPSHLPLADSNDMPSSPQQHPQAPEPLDSGCLKLVEKVKKILSEKKITLDEVIISTTNKSEIIKLRFCKAVSAGRKDRIISKLKKVNFIEFEDPDTNEVGLSIEKKHFGWKPVNATNATAKKEKNNNMPFYNKPTIAIAPVHSSYSASHTVMSALDLDTNNEEAQAEDE